MAQSTVRSGRMVGDYLVSRQIGSGSFSVVWKATHRLHGTEVAIKEIAMSRLNKKLQESLMSEIFILRRINHPNIIRLLDMIESPGKIHLVLEYCKGGDLSMYLQSHGSVPEATAKHFMLQLAAGLKVLRDNDIIHRDLKPQNLLLSTDENDADLKIADFGFARSLQPRGLAETLCGSPLYMAPEIMQLQKYDAKADLWSVGAILFQLVTGRTPFTGNSQIQLLQNILRSTDLHFPADCRGLSLDCIDLCQKLLRRNPVERLTFEEFFNHPFFSDRQSCDFSREMSTSGTKNMDGFLSSGSSPSRNMEESSQEDCLPFPLDDDSSGPEGSPSYLKKTSSVKSYAGFHIDTRFERKEVESSPLKHTDLASRYSGINQRVDNNRFRYETHINSDKRNHREPTRSTDPRSLIAPGRADDSQDTMDQDFVIVSGPPADMPSSSSSSSKPYNFPFKSQSPPVNRSIGSTAPMPIVGATGNSIGRFGSLDSQHSAPSTSHGSMDLGDAFEQPSTHSLTRIRSLRKCAATIAELVHERIESDKHLEAFSIQLAILAIWKQALHICHTQAISGLEGSPRQDINKLRGSSSLKHNTQNSEKIIDLSHSGSEEISSQIQKQFIQEIELAEELAKSVEPGNTKMPDAMETIFEAALDLGKLGGVKEVLGEIEIAGSAYSKAVRLLVFLLIEAPTLILNPPLSLPNSVRYRLRTYIDILSRRLKHLQSHRRNNSGTMMQGTMMNKHS